MSVINQMLKDLEHRKPLQPLPPGYRAGVQSVAETPRAPGKGLIFVSAALTVLLVSIGLWQARPMDGVLASTQKQPELADAVQAATAPPVMPPRSEPAAPSLATNAGGSITTTAPKRADLPAPPSPDPVVQAATAKHKAYVSSSPHRKRKDLERRRSHRAAQHANQRAPQHHPRHNAQDTRSAHGHARDESAAELYRKGTRLAASSDQKARAEDTLERSLRLDPNNRDARLLLARQYAQEGDDDRAESLLRSRPELAEDTEAASLHAQVLLRQGRTAQSERVLAPVLQSAGDDPELNGVAGALRQKQGRHREAIEHYQKVVSRKPDSSRGWLGLAISLEASERYDDALRAYEHALRKGPATRAVQDYVITRINSLRGTAE